MYVAATAVKDALHLVRRACILDKRVEWECNSSHPVESPASAWTGTHVIFEISESPADVV